MSDTLSSRVGRVVSGGINAIVDAIEGAMPETIIQESMREIDGVIEDVRAELGKVIAQRHLANKQLIEKSSRHADLSDQIKVALEKGRDDLAEAAIEQQLDIEAQTPILETTIADLGDSEKELEGYTAALQAKRREMEAEFQSLLKAQRDSTLASSADGAKGGASMQGRADKATGAFDRMLAKHGGMGIGGVEGKKSADLAELEKLSRQHRIEERLAAMRSSMKKS